MHYFLPVLLISLTVQLAVAPPVTQKKTNGEHDNENKVVDAEEMEGIMEYQRYLSEVVQALESDPDFRAKLEKADQEDIRTGRIADQLEFLNHNVRTRLDELKREELERLRHLATKENELTNGLDMKHLKIFEHLDHSNTHTFEILDLKKLIAKTSKDLSEADRRRREEFKQYEMQKKFEEQEKLKAMNDADRIKYEDELKTEKEKHKKHEPVHHPGSKQQLEEVWEKQDHMESEDFNPKTFFFLHDVDNNGVWDQDEVKALFLKELDKMYTKGATPDDVLKRVEEMERMREHVFNEADVNKDGLISFDEFLEQTKKPDFQQDEGWEGLDAQQIYTPEEFEAYEKHKLKEVEQMIAKGMLPPHPGNVPAHHESFPPQYVNVPVPQGVHPEEYHRYPDQNVPHSQQFQQQNQYHSEQAVPQQYPNAAVHDQVPQQYQPHVQHAQAQQQPHVQHAQAQQQPHVQHAQAQQQAQFQGQVPQYQVVQHHQQQQQLPQPPQHVPQQVQQQVPQHMAQQQHYQDQVKHENQGQLPVQPQQAPVQQAATVQQPNAVNEVPHNIQANVVPPLQNVQGAQAQVQQEIHNRNQIHAGGKV